MVVRLLFVSDCKLTQSTDRRPASVMGTNLRPWLPNALPLARCVWTRRERCSLVVKTPCTIYCTCVAFFCLQFLLTATMTCFALGEVRHRCSFTISACPRRRARRWNRSRTNWPPSSTWRRTTTPGIRESLPLLFWFFFFSVFAMIVAVADCDYVILPCLFVSFLFSVLYLHCYEFVFLGLPCAKDFFLFFFNC